LVLRVGVIPGRGRVIVVGLCPGMETACRAQARDHQHDHRHHPSDPRHGSVLPACLMSGLLFTRCRWCSRGRRRRRTGGRRRQAGHHTSRRSGSHCLFGCACRSGQRRPCVGARLHCVSWSISWRRKVIARITMKDRPAAEPVALAMKSRAPRHAGGQHHGDHRIAKPHHDRIPFLSLPMRSAMAVNRPANHHILAAKRITKAAINAGASG
jgi:hypothetical protein